MDIYRTNARFDVICKRCKTKFEVMRNFGGGIRRPDLSNGYANYNPAKCNCGSLRLEVF